VGLAGLALALQAGHSHAFATEHAPSLLLYAQGLHLLAGGAWLGGLLPLLILVRDVPSEPAAEVLRRFSQLATVCVAAIAGTACFQGWVLGGGVAGLIGTAYGGVLLLKAALFAALLVLAATNRFHLTQALEREDREFARWALLRTIAAETVLGVMVVLAAGVLSGLEPGMHARPAEAGTGLSKN
jgi:putative copper resistance protein D